MAKTKRKTAKKIKTVEETESGAVVEVEDKPESVQTSFPFGANQMVSATKKKKTAKKKPAAKKDGKSGSDKVREYYADHKEASNKEIAEATKVHPSQVSQVLKALKGGKKKKNASKKSTRGDGISSGHTGNGSAAQWVTAAMALGIDVAIAKLQRIKAAIED